MATFAGVFPYQDPEYVIVITYDEAETQAYGRTWRTAGWTAAPTVREALTRIAPILGMRPQLGPARPAPGVASQLALAE